MAQSFFRFVLGFLAFIGVSFAVTFATDKYSSSQNPEQTASVGSIVQQK